MPDLSAPFPYWGGKSRIAAVIWEGLGADVPNYIETCGGSLAALLQRPGGAGKIETVNDASYFVMNFWRAIKRDPWKVAEWCEDPVAEADLHARHEWLMTNEDFVERMHRDPYHCDFQVAAWWCWGICCWVGSGWCDEGIRKQQLPHLAVTSDGAATGRGILSKAAVARNTLPQQAPHLSSDMGVFRKQRMPSLGNDRGIHGVSTTPGTYLHALKTLTVPEAPECFGWFFELACRLRHVRLAHGDWTRVVTPSILGKGRNVGGRRPCGVFIDKPYLPSMRTRKLYAKDEPHISQQVFEWALEHGDDPDLRIAVCGYEGEHDFPSSWRKHAWVGARGYASEDNDNRKKERVWFSPHCLKPARSLLDLLGTP